MRRRARRRYANPFAPMNLLKQGMVGAAGFLGARLFGNLIANASFVPAAIRPHAAIAGSLAAMVATYYLPNVKGLTKLKKWRPALLTGMATNLIMQIVDRFMPASLQPYLGAPSATASLAADAQAYEAALTGMGEYVRQPLGAWGAQGSAEQLGEYISEGGPVTEALAEYVPEDLGVDEDGAVIPNYSSLDAGVDGSGLCGDPNLEYLDDDLEFLSGDGGAADAPFRALRAKAAARGIAAAGGRMRRPVGEVVQAATNAAKAAAGTPVVTDGLRQAIAEGVAEGLKVAAAAPTLERPLAAATAAQVAAATPVYPVQDSVMGAPAEVVAIPMGQQFQAGNQPESLYGTGSFAGKVGGLFHNHILH